MAATLIGRERVKRMFERRDHDRVPRHDHFWLETANRWQAEGFCGNRAAALDLLDGDFQSLGTFYVSPYGGERRVLREDEETCTIRDEWAATIRRWKDRSGAPEHVGFECKDRPFWEKTVKPALRGGGCSGDLDALEANFALARQKGRWCYLTSFEAFEFMRRLMGDEIFLMAMAEEPEWVLDVAETETDRVLRDLDSALEREIKPDGVLMCGDMAYNHGTLCSPRMYRELIRPSHQRLAAWAHRHGMSLIYHTDGDVNSVIEDFIVAGFDCLNPLEAKAGMDVRRLAPAYGDRLAFLGNIDVMVLAGGDRGEIEHEIGSKLEAGMATRAYAYHSDHSVPPSVRLETYRFVIELLDRYGQYEPLRVSRGAARPAPALHEAESV